MAVGSLSLLAYMAISLIAYGSQYGILALVSPDAMEGDGSVLPLLATFASYLLGAIAEVVAAPIPAVALALLYFDVRVRKEGLDVELLAREMDESPEAGTPVSPVGSDDRR
jgi:hypothetical protein